MNDRGGSSRLYEHIARDLSDKIFSGYYPIGTRLPAERILAQHYAVSRPTIREAVIALEIDGLVDVRVGSGVHVIASSPVGGVSAQTDVGPFELLEARRAIEGEACALAAVRMEDADLRTLETLLEKMRSAHIAISEEADRQFHLTIARATRNSAMASVIEALWDARARSPQYRLLSDKAHDAGVIPRHEEHNAILCALVTRDPDTARAAMRNHLGNVLDAILEATEVHEVERARAKVAERRQRFSV